MKPVIVAGIRAEPLDAAALVDLIRRDDCGAVVVFEGTTRSPNEGVAVIALDYESFEERANVQLEAFAREAAQRWGLGGVVAVHRIGRVPPSQASVLVAVSAPHRAEAFGAARALIDRIKDEAFVWKKEITDGGGTWVEPAR